MSKIRIFNLKLTPEGFNTKELDDFVENVKVLNIWEHMLIDQNIWAILIRYEETQYIHPKKSTYTYPPTPTNSKQASSHLSHSTPPSQPPSISYQSQQKSSQYETLTKEEQERFDCLKQWRKAQVQDSSRPAYSVLNDQVLYEISRKNPQTLGELKAIKGMGDSKLSQYGEGLIKTLSTKIPTQVSEDNQ
jgi:superfamily II DNA helicase RecQ